MLLAGEIFLYLLLASVVLCFAWGLWRFATREAELVRLVPLPLPLANSPASIPPSTKAPAPSPTTSPARRLRRQLHAARDIADPALLVVLAAATWHERNGLVAVPHLTRALHGLGIAPGDALRILVELDAGGVLELRPDASNAMRAAHLCPRSESGLLALARVRIGAIEEPVNVVSAASSSAHVNSVERPADDEPELHYAATGEARTACGIPIGELAHGLAGGTRELGWTTHGPSATHGPCRRALGLPDRLDGDVDDDARTILVESAPIAPSSYKTLVSAQPGGS